MAFRAALGIQEDGGAANPAESHQSRQEARPIGHGEADEGAWREPRRTHESRLQGASQDIDFLPSHLTLGPQDDGLSSVVMKPRFEGLDDGILGHDLQEGEVLRLGVYVESVVLGRAVSGRRYLVYFPAVLRRAVRSWNGSPSPPFSVPILGFLVFGSRSTAGPFWRTERGRPSRALDLGAGFFCGSSEPRAGGEGSVALADGEFRNDVLTTSPGPSRRKQICP